MKSQFGNKKVDIAYFVIWSVFIFATVMTIVHMLTN